MEQKEIEVLSYPLSPACLTLGPLINPSIYMRGHSPVACSLSATLNNPSVWEEV